MVEQTRAVEEWHWESNPIPGQDIRNRVFCVAFVAPPVGSAKLGF